MLEYFYKERRTLVDFRRGPLGPHFDGFAAHLKKRGYAVQSAHSILGPCCRFNGVLVDQGMTNVRRITPELIKTFIDGYLAHNQSPTLYLAQLDTRRALRHLTEYLVSAGVLKPPVIKRVKAPYSWMLDPYLGYLREERQLTANSIDRITTRLHDFLKGLKGEVTRERFKSLKANRIEACIKGHLKDSRENLKCLASSLRGFLQFCVRQGYTTEDMSTVIPHIPSYRLASIPKGMEDSALQKVLNTIDKNTPHGARDYAMLILLMAYGIRAKQAAELVLDDIDWPRSTIRIRALKGGKEVVLPLLEAVGESLLRFLRHRPPESFYRQVFLSMRAPYKPLTGLAISQIVRKAMHIGGVQMPGGGARTFRHSWAIRALAHDSPMKAIADVLGHKCLDTTFIYAKADLKTLRQVAMPWPEVKS
jgi:site-specific recombinase XerD